MTNSGDSMRESQACFGRKRGMLSPEFARRVVARETTIALTTNGIGPEARTPLLEPEGRQFIYPYNRRDRLINRMVRRRWRALVIENEHLRAVVLPDLGGRLFALTDKATGRDVFASPQRFRFGRIHLRGAWAPVGVELNFPKGHTVASTSPVTCLLFHEADGGASIVSGATDLVTGMRWEVRFTLRPGIGRLFVHNRFTNPTPLPHGAMFWHNAAVWVSEGFRFQSRARLAYVLGQMGPFPWRNGRDYTWYKNRLWSDDLFVVGLPEDWFGYFNHDIDFGALHVADRNLMPGKKFFSWGASADGRMWSRVFDLGGRHYGELQVGFLETQGQKARFEPGKCFESDQCWYPIAGLGDVLQANEQVAVGLRDLPVKQVESASSDAGSAACASEDADSSRSLRRGRATQGAPRLTVVVTEPTGPVTVTCWDRASGRVLAERTLRLEPLRVESVPLTAAPGGKGVRVCVTSDTGDLLDREVAPLRNPSARDLERARRRIHPNPPQTPAGLVARAVDAMNWQHFSGAERLLDRAIEAKGRLPAAHRELGWLALQSVDTAQAQRHFRRALEADPNDAGAALGLAHALSTAGNSAEALRWYERAAKDPSTRASAALGRAQALSRGGRREDAAACLRSLVDTRPDQADACLLLAALEWSLGQEDAAVAHLRQGVEQAPTHPLALALPWLRAREKQVRRHLWQRLRDASSADVQVVIEAAVALAETGLVQEAVSLLAAMRTDRRFPRHPMAGYLAAFWLKVPGTFSGTAPEGEQGAPTGKGTRCRPEPSAAASWLEWAEQCPPEGVNPSRPAEAEALCWAVRERPADANAHLFLGNWHAARGAEAAALRAWRRAVAIDPGSGLAHRNIGFALFRRGRRPTEAVAHYRAAVARYPDEVDFYLEAERLLAAMGRMAERVTMLDGAPPAVRQSDKWIKSYAVALQDAGRPAEALAAMSGPELVPWEGETQMRRCWVECHLALGRQALAGGDLERAEAHFTECMRYPANLLQGEPYHRERSFGLYHLALVAEARGEMAKARMLHSRCAEERHRMTHRLGVEATYYSALSALWLSQRAKARAMLRPVLADRLGGHTPAGRQRRHGPRSLTRHEWLGYDHHRDIFGTALALKALGRYDEARRALRMVLRLYGPQAEAVWHLKTLRRFGLEAIRMPPQRRRGGATHSERAGRK